MPTCEAHRGGVRFGHVEVHWLADSRVAKGLEKRLRDVSTTCDFADLIAYLESLKEVKSATAPK